MTMRMSDLRRGQSGQVLEVKTDGSIRRRLLELGLVPGTDIERVMSSPTGDPVCYRVRGALIALRGDDAGQVRVEVPA